MKGRAWTTTRERERGDCWRRAVPQIGVKHRTTAQIRGALRLPRRPAKRGSKSAVYCRRSAGGISRRPRSTFATTRRQLRPSRSGFLPVTFSDVATLDGMAQEAAELADLRVEGQARNRRTFNCGRHTISTLQTVVAPDKREQTSSNNCRKPITSKPLPRAVGYAAPALEAAKRPSSFCRSRGRGNFPRTE